MDIITESTLTDTVLYKAFSAQNDISAIVRASLKYSTIITKDMIMEQIIQIQRSKLTPISDEVLQGYLNGDVMLIYAKRGKVPQLLPFITLKMNGRYKSFVFVNNYGTLVEKEDTAGGTHLNIPMVNLYTLMEAAYVSKRYYEYPARVTKNISLMTTCCRMYSSMFLRILNKEYALSLNQAIFNEVNFCISKFFLENIWDMTSKETSKNYAFNMLSPTYRPNVDLLSDEYDLRNITNVEQLIDFIKTLDPSLEKLNLRYFTQCWLNTYKASTLFGVECLPYFLFTLEATIISSFIVNQPIISEIAKRTKGINTFYAELAKNI